MKRLVIIIEIVDGEKGLILLVKNHHLLLDGLVVYWIFWVLVLLLIIHQIHEDGAVDEIVVDIVEDDEVEDEVADGKYIFNLYLFVNGKAFI